MIADAYSRVAPGPPSVDDAETRAEDVAIERREVRAVVNAPALGGAHHESARGHYREHRIGLAAGLSTRLPLHLRFADELALPYSSSS